MYYDIYKASQQLNDKLLLELDFVLKVNTAAGRLLVSMEQEQGQIDFGDAWGRWVPIFKDVVKSELEKRRLGGPAELGEEATAPPAPAGRAPATGAAPPPSTRVGEDVEEEVGGEEPGELPDETAASLREKLRAKKLGVKKK
jgi:hypothetical protein